MLKEVVVSWEEVRWIYMADEPKLCSQFVQLLKHRLCNVWLGVVTEKIWALCVDQCWLQVLQFSMDLINLLSTLLRCNGLTEIQKAVVDQTSSRPPKVRPWPFWCKFVFGKCSGTSSWSNHWAAHYWLLHKIHFSLDITIQSRNGSLLGRIREEDTSIILICGQFIRNQVIELFQHSKESKGGMTENVALSYIHDQV